jgi:hypothetical protein
MEFIAKLIEWLKLPPQILVALFLVSSICAFSHESFTDSLGITKFVSDYRTWFGVSFLFSVVTLATYPIAALYKWLLVLVNMNFQRAEVKEHLRALTKDEKEILRHYIDKNIRTKYFKSSNGVAKSLAKANVLYSASMVGSHALGGYPYNIYPWVVAFLKKDK